MKIEELKAKEPIWGSWYVENKIAEGSFGSVYRIYRQDFGKRHSSALKVISIPKSEDEVKRILYEGMTEKSASLYYEGLVKDLYSEICLMAELKGKSNIVSYEDHEILPKAEGIGYDIFIRMELLTSLNEYVLSKDITVHEVIKLGKDICNALVLCSKRGIIHRDIKPDNIFISQDGDYKLGDFGIARQMEKNATAMSVKGTYEYMAPEVYKGQEYDIRVDIYSLGIVLYTLLNGRRIPFLPVSAEVISHTQKQEALQRRFSGEALTKPAYGTETVSSVILKACAYHPEERYQTPEEFKKALEAVDYEFSYIPTGMNMGVGQLAVADEEKTVDMYSSTVMLEPGKNALEMSGERHHKEGKSLNILEMEKKKLKNQKLLILGMAAMGLAVLCLVFGAGIKSFLVNQKYTEILDNVSDTVSQEWEKASETLKEEQREVVEQEDVQLQDWYNTDLTELDMTHDWTSLKQLELGGNQISDLIALEKADELIYLSLSKNKVKDISSLQNMSKLQVLALDHNKIKDISPVVAMTALERLDISNNQIEDISPLVELSQLKYLNLSNNGIEDLQALAGLENLEILILSDNPVAKEQLEELEKSLPQCRIVI